jgi:hypothetical protein
MSSYNNRLNNRGRRPKERIKKNHAIKSVGAMRNYQINLTIIAANSAAEAKKAYKDKWKKSPNRYFKFLGEEVK